MNVIALNHANIRAPQPLLDEVRDFYINILGLQPGWRPEVPVHGYWLYSGEHPVIHLMEDQRPLDQITSLEASFIDHIAFTCDNLSALEAHLVETGVQYQRTDLSGAVQLLLRDPTGLGIELIFPVQQLPVSTK